MTEPQVWTLIGVFAAALLGLLTVMTTTFLRVLRAEIGGVNTRIDSVDTRIDSLRSELSARIDVVDTRIDGLRTEMTTRFEGVDRRIDDLDRDVQILARHTFPDP